jgi:hypothetical protein
MLTSMRTVALLSLLTASCAGSLGARKGVTPAFDSQRSEVQGTLIELRHYFDTGAIGGDHVLCAESSARAELPVGVLTRSGTVVMLTSRPSRMATYVAREVRVAGQLTANGQLLVPSSLHVRDGSHWITGGL